MHEHRTCLFCARVTDARVWLGLSRRREPRDGSIERLGQGLRANRRRSGARASHVDNPLSCTQTTARSTLPRTPKALLAQSVQVAHRRSTVGKNHDYNTAGTSTDDIRHDDSPNLLTRTSVHNASAGNYGSRSTRARLKTARRREQCRLSQVRYRLRQDEKVQGLYDAITKLREELPLLELQRDRILFGTKQSIFNVVVEYFHLFRHGIRRNKVQDPQTQQQLVFLRITMAANVSLAERRGVNALVEQWHRYSSHFEDLHFQLEHMEERGKKLATVSASMSVTIGEQTLKCVFPHLVKPELGETLLGRRLMLPCSLCFEWDDASSRVVRLEMTVDFLTPINRVLNSLSDTAFVLSQALITLDGAVGKCDI
ncbi:unnamed protein product [Phytophthora fragariaefolia]|uniref:Unnamed protein product n=1 Tax=Phytophthora fragariaefolia TaxID=1490495 RepID=A0A9W7DCF5_9STRA|nr:unnamed protein product [Phytophthora fragariaefolia]